MINVHLNGDLIRCPDIAAIQLRAAEVREKHNICKYNYHEVTCQTWRDHCIDTPEIKKISDFGHCSLYNSDNCPGHKKQIETGKIKKTFKIDNKIYRKLSSSAHLLVKTSKSKTLFLTLTFPRFRREWSKHTKKLFYETIINEKFSQFVENLRRRHGCGGYIAVKEYGGKNGRVHFHLLCSIPFIDFRTLNRIWINTISDICYSSNIAVRTDPKTKFISNPDRAMRYVCKYFTKAMNKESFSRLYFISRNLLTHIEPDIVNSETGEVLTEKRVSNIQKNIVGSTTEILKGYKGIYINQSSDYTTTFRITDKGDFRKFCNEFLYPLFKIEGKNGVFYSFPADNNTS